MLDSFKSDVLYLYSKFNLEIFIMKITNPKLEVVRFNADDVIATSIGALTGKTGLFYFENGNGGYDSVNGTFGEFDGSRYEITGINTHKENVGGERSGILEMADFYTPEGVTLPMVPLMENMAKQAYDVTSNGDFYYSDGLSYFERYWNQ